MTYKVTRTQEIRHNACKEVTEGIVGWKEFINEQHCTEFSVDGDYYAVYEDMDRADDHDLNKYAVYHHVSGDLVCLVSDAGRALDLCYVDNDFRDKRHELYRQIAILAGWPERLPTKRFTVRLHRIMDIEVRAENTEQASHIGQLLASGKSSYSRLLKEVWPVCNDEYQETRLAPDENDGVWDLSLTEEECKNILKED